MLLDVLRKVWTTLVSGHITKVLLKHRVLRATQHAYLPHRGTDKSSPTLRQRPRRRGELVQADKPIGAVWVERPSYEPVGPRLKLCPQEGREGEDGASQRYAKAAH